ncbi:30S ribosomal protein S4 [Candidatus Dependentiae bacterium]|nr:30S ribosomal protein S4 [Candidatus Dependentiae bacterium]
MEKRSVGTQGTGAPAKGDRTKSEGGAKRTARKSEYGRQLEEKQKVKEMYGVREAQFRRFFALAVRAKEATGESLLILLERRLDNVMFRSKMTTSRRQSRQIIVHGHVLVNGKKVYSPSFLVSVNDEISLAPQALNKAVFIEQVVDKRLQSNVKVPEWIEIDKRDRKGRILRLPVRADVQTPIEEHLIVEGYSK